MLRPGITVTLWLLFATLTAAAGQQDPVRFGRDVRPILADRCFACHGPDSNARQAGLRLDNRDDATAPRRGGPAIAPGRPEDSELVRRIDAADPARRMPPADCGKGLSDAERDLLRRWIAEGAAYAEHWAFVAPKQPAVPARRGDRPDTEPLNPIDAFIHSRLQPAGLSFAPAADRPSLIRRVAFDVTGLPPSLSELEAFLADDSPRAYARMVDRYLDSPHYGEHMARQWMDLARYADTSGYQYDRERTQWAWRDWVIAAFQENMPYDRFTIEQIAGDLLPGAGVDQIVATGFHRNHPITIEGGVVDEEYRVEYVMDRVKTVGTTWLGLTIECARCHDHKFDPITQEDFYRIYAFFNQVPERGLNGFDPKVEVMAHGVRAELEELDRQIAALERRHRVTAEELVAWETDLREAGGWMPLPNTGDGARVADRWTAIRSKVPLDSLTAEIVTPGDPPVLGRFVRVELSGPQRYLGLAEVEVMSNGVNVARSGKARQSSVGYGGAPARAIDGRRDGRWSSGTITHTIQQDDPWWEVDLGRAVPIKGLSFFNRTDACCIDRWNRFRVKVLDGERKTVWERQTDQKGGAHVEMDLGGPMPIPLTRQGQRYIADTAIVTVSPSLVRVSTEPPVAADGGLEISTDSRWSAWRALPAPLLEILERPAARRTEAERAALASHVFERTASRAKVRADRDGLRRRRDAVAKGGRTTVMVLRHKPGLRATKVLERGQYDQGRQVVTPGVPAALSPMAESLPRDRLGLARWLTSGTHPLTSRVVVNRLWAQCFGRGIVETADNFGLQGSWPTHPELLDWLATEFVSDGWNIKKLLRRILLSVTYRQSSRGQPDARADRLFARGRRFRLEAESIRDQALAVSGLLNRTIGGRSVYPYQPEGLWQEINNRPGLSRRYPKPILGQLHRRSLYTFWKRTLPPPTMQLFDAPNREVCTASRSRTNTPLQALALLHDPQFVEAARALAQRVLVEADDDRDARLRFAFRLCTQREPAAAELDQLRALLTAELARFAADPVAARKTLAVGLTERDDSIPAEQHAAWLSVARLILNLSEVLTRG